jgi:hypothetical protein
MISLNSQGSSMQKILTELRVAPAASFETDRFIYTSNNGFKEEVPLD